MTQFQPKYYGPPRPMLRPWNPADHVRLLGWVFFTPSKLDSYRAKFGEDATKGIGTWLASTLLWLPLLVPLIAVGVRTIPVQSRMIPIWLLLAGIVIGWLLTAWIGTLEYPSAGSWRHAIHALGPVFEGAFLIVFGVAFGIAFGVAFITGLDIMEIIVVPAVFGTAGLLSVVAAFGVAFGVAYIVAEKVAYGGAFIIAPMVAMCLTGFVAFGVGFVGAFVAIFLTTFGMAFIGAFIVTFVLTALVVERLERDPASPLARGVRVGGLVALLLAHSALVWICLLGWWRLLVG